MIYISQIIMLYTLNLYRGVCQLYLDKTWGGGRIMIFHVILECDEGSYYFLKFNVWFPTCSF